MLNAFIESWALFHHAWLSAWLIAALLGGLGVAVLARDQVFLGAAMAQASTCAVAMVLWLMGAASGVGFAGRSLHALCGVAMAMATALAVGVGQRHREAMTAWIFLAGSAFSVLAVANNPHGMEEVNRLVASSLIGATSVDAWMFAALALASALTLAVAGARLATVVLDAAFAAAIGLRVRRWEILLALWLGLAMGLALQVAGLLYVFGCLLLPSLAARELCRELRVMVWVAPAIGVVAAMAGTVLANGWDLPPAQVTVALMALLVPLAAAVGRLRR